MGARLYLPTTARFLQVDPIDGGTPNAYVYPPDPINSSDYSGMRELKVGNANCNCRVSVTYYYGSGQSNGGGNIIQSSAAATRHLQPTAPARIIQGPGAILSNKGRTGPATVTPQKKRTWIDKVGRVAGSVAKVGTEFAKYAVLGPSYLPRAAYNTYTSAPPEAKAAIDGCGYAMIGDLSVGAILYKFKGNAYITAGSLAVSCGAGAVGGYTKYVSPELTPAVQTLDGARQGFELCAIIC